MSFKPCYKWNTFNTKKLPTGTFEYMLVLNLVINGIPSILQKGAQLTAPNTGFKPCYKWNTFNTENDFLIYLLEIGFKPCYKWNTFNTVLKQVMTEEELDVLNLVINGIPSILPVNAVVTNELKF